MIFFESNNDYTLWSRYLLVYLCASNFIIMTNYSLNDLLNRTVEDSTKLLTYRSYEEPFCALYKNI